MITTQTTWNIVIRNRIELVVIVANVHSVSELILTSTYFLRKVLKLGMDKPVTVNFFGFNSAVFGYSVQDFTT